MTKLPPLSVLLPPREPFTFHSSAAPADSYSQQPQPQHTCCTAPHYQHPQAWTQQHYQQPQAQHYHNPQQQMHYPQQQQQVHYNEHYNYNSTSSSAPASPSSPTWWNATSQQPQQQPQTYTLAPFWKNTRGLYDNNTLQQRSTDLSSLRASLSSSSLSSLASSASSTTSSAPSSPAKAPTATLVRPKKSRYLREMDRRAIIKRLDNGEKQCALAKEFSVSRSSICNLFKHRDEVLSRAAHQSPFSKHPKRCKKIPQQLPSTRRFV